ELLQGLLQLVEKLRHRADLLRERLLDVLLFHLGGELADLQRGDRDDADDDREGQQRRQRHGQGAAEVVPLEPQYQRRQDEGEQDGQGKRDEDGLAPVEDAGDKYERADAVERFLQRGELGHDGSHVNLGVRRGRWGQGRGTVPVTPARSGWWEREANPVP